MKFKGLKIQHQILIGFLAFTVLIVVVLWFFQVGLLNTFYKAIKHSEIKQMAITASQFTDEEELLVFLEDINKNNNIDIKITEADGQNIASVTSFSNITFRGLSASLCAGIYAQTLANGGEYLEWVTLDNIGGGYEELVYLYATPGDDGKLYILNSRVTPVDATVDTLQVQLWCVTAIMIVVSTALALFLARKISRPIMDINEAAKQFATADYSIKFIPQGARETHELAYTLNYAAAELSQVENLRRELIANVSHDLRTPLTMITGFAEVMKDIPDENTAENLQIIIDESDRLRKLVNDLLDVSRLESGSVEFKQERVNITRLVDDILMRFEKLVDFEFEFYRGNDINVVGDELRLTQVIYNLISNAVNYSLDDKTIIVRQSVVDGDFVLIEVEDRGEGIEQDKLKYIWDRYYKVDKNHQRAIVGSGVGLSIVKKIIDSHGGSYGVKSKFGVGSTFWFKLKIDQKLLEDTNI